MAPIVAPALIAAAGATWLFGRLSSGLVAAAAFMLVIVLPIYSIAWGSLTFGSTGRVAPPGLPMLLATATALVPMMLASSAPWGQDSAMWSFAGVAGWSIVGTCWLVKAGLAWAHDGWAAVRARKVRWGFALVLGVAGFAAAMSPLPLLARFEFNRSAIEDAAGRVRSGQLHAGDRVALGTWSARVEDPVDSAEASFYLGTYDIEFVGIAEFPAGIEPANDEYFTWRHIDGRWWLWRNLLSR
jgi:hypothetical protein